MTILDEITARRRERVAEARRAEPLEGVRDRAAAAPPARGLEDRLARWPAGRRAVIAEVKRRSPSRGALRPGLDPAALARDYEAAGALAVSVITEPDFFGGSLADLVAARAAVGLPLLRKDFVVDPYQVWEARAAGADLVLLIVAVLGERTAEYVAVCREAGVEPLVEVHDAAEFDAAVAAGARLVGVNNRDLRTFRVDLDTTRRLAPRAPAGVVVVSESGLTGPADLDALERRGARVFLVGEALVTAPDPAAALRPLVHR